jgi:hypothetical protein
MRKSLLTLGVGAALILVAGRSAQAGAPNRIYFLNQDVHVGDTNVTVPVQVDTDQVRHGFSLSIKFDQTMISIVNVTTTGSTSANADWSKGEIRNVDGKLRWSVIMSLPDTLQDPFDVNKTIPIGTNEVLINITINVLATTDTTTVIIPQDDLGTPAGGWVNILSYKGDASIHPELAGGTIHIIPVTQPNPVPTITTIDPTNKDAGSASFLLTVNGTGFVNGASTIRWKGADRTTAFVSDTKLTTTVAAPDVATAGSAAVTVFTGPPGGGTSNSVDFTINTVSTGNKFLQGDCSQDGALDLSDAVKILNFLFIGLDSPIVCFEACHVTAPADHDLDITDAVDLLAYLFLGTFNIAPPFPNCNSASAALCATALCPAGH